MTPPGLPPGYLSAEEFAQRVGLGVNYIRQMCRRRQLSGLMYPGTAKGRYWINERELTRFQPVPFGPQGPEGEETDDTASAAETPSQEGQAHETTPA